MPSQTPIYAIPFVFDRKPNYQQWYMIQKNLVTSLGEILYMEKITVVYFDNNNSLIGYDDRSTLIVGGGDIGEIFGSQLIFYFVSYFDFKPKSNH